MRPKLRFRLFITLCAPSILIGIGWVSEGNTVVNGEKLDSRTNQSTALAPKNQMDIVKDRVLSSDEVKDGFTQFASFLKSRQQSLGSVTAGTTDPDWDVAWYGKGDLHPSDAIVSPCQPDRPRPAAKAKRATNTIKHQSTKDEVSASRHPFKYLELSNLEMPAQLRPELPTLPNPCKGIVVSVLYNETAAKHILSDSDETSLWNGEALKKMLTAGTKAITEFPLGSVIVKELWEPVPDTKSIQVWDPGNSYFQNPTGDMFEGIYKWPTRSQIDVAPKPCDQEAYLFKGDAGVSASQSDNPPLPKSCFISTLVGNQTLYLVGLNIAHKTSKGWYWYAFSWTNNIPAAIFDIYSTSRWYANDPRRGDQPGESVPDWNHYVMNITNRQIEQILGKSSVCFNPYLEGFKGLGILTNCVRCHQFAAYGLSSNSNDAQTSLLGSKSTSPAPDDITRFLGDKLQTDFLWSPVTHLEK